MFENGSRTGLNGINADKYGRGLAPDGSESANTFGD
jgi:hypothetical protein